MAKRSDALRRAQDGAPRQPRDRAPQRAQGDAPRQAQDSALEQRIWQAVRSQRQETVTVLSCLLAVFDDLHYIPEAAIDIIARHLRCTNNDVWNTASFYTNFRFSPPNRHIVDVCWGPACHVMGAPHVAQELLRALGLPNEGDTADGRVTLRDTTCLGCCSRAPAIAVDHHLVGNVTPAAAVEAVERLDGADGGESH